MHTKLLLLFSFLAVFASCHSQPQATDTASDMTQIQSVFERMEMQGVDTRQQLLYGYFFFGKDISRLEKLKNALSKQAYRTVTLKQEKNGQHMLHVERAEPHTRQSLYEREQQLRQLASTYQVAFDGFDVGNIDPKQPLVSDASFSRFALAKGSNDLFALGIRLYDLDINDKAEVVFRECIRRNINRDTASFKLGNLLTNQDRTEEGISALVQATEYNPRYFHAFFNLGAICYEHRRFSQAVAFYQQADKLKPNDDQVLYGIAAAQYALQQYKESAKHCQRALEINRGNVYAKQLWEMLKGKN
jgi:tetratricopeptide (TPR) repeat protein